MTEHEKLEKIIKELECCVSLNNNWPKCTNCDYADEFHNYDCETYLLRDALMLLKAQEPVIVEERADTGTINCPKCGQQFARVGRDKSIYLDTDEEPNYCPKCGQAVKWE